MYVAHPGGTVINIQGLECNIPPVGYVFNVFTQQLERREIISRSSVASEQYWEREELPDWYIKRMRQVEKIRATGDLNYSDAKCNEYEHMQFDRRLNGVWFMNNGVPTYLTGTHWTYLQWWRIDTGYPYYRKADRDYFYFQQYCIEDPKCAGMIEVAKRRDGKSYRGGLFVFEYPARSKEANGGIQSKTVLDAKKFFAKCIINPFKKLPKFFRPNYDKSGGVTPKSEIRFQNDNVRGKNAEINLDGPELESAIDFRASDAIAYDGYKIHRGLCDEWAKTEECNIYERHNVLKYCIKNEKGEYIGKLLYTSTVEKLAREVNGVNKAAKKMWDDSDQCNRKNGVTKTGLYRFFTSAAITRYCNKYGEPDVERATQEILAEWKLYEDDPVTLGQLKQKEPLTIQDAFRPDSAKCLYNDFKLHARRDILSWLDATERGDLEWKNGIRDTEVIWVPKKNGKWEKPKGFNLEKHERNLVEKIGHLWYPKNNYRFGSGVDPYDHDEVQDDGKKSSAASFVKQKNNILKGDDFFNHAYVLKYHARPPKAAIMYEDMIMQCVFCGCSILYESQKKGIKTYFENRGYGAFLMHMEGYKDSGIPSTPENKQTGSELLEAQIEDHSDKLFFIDQIDDFFIFNINATKKHDLTMATIWTETACYNRKYAKSPEPELEDIEEFFSEYEINYHR